jgi:transcriptional regulatory protein AMDR
MEEGTEGCRKHLVEFIDQEELSYRPIDKEARITYVGTDVSNINFLVRQADKRTIVHHFPTNRIDRRLTAHEPDRLPVEAFELPEKAIVDELLHAYFEKINPGFPVVDEGRFMSLYKARDPADPPSLLLLQTILLVGAHVSPGRETYKPIFFRRAKMLIDSRFERNRDVIVQAALLLTWYSDGPEDVVANAWHWIGFGARTAMGLGMHRDADPSTLVEHNKKMWRRVWWLLVQCDILISLQYGRPLAM